MFVYKITNSANGKTYIGVTTKTVAQRWKAHISNAFKKGVNYRLYQAMRKHGQDAFLVETVYEAVDLKELLAVERALITQYGCYTPRNGYNQTLGGDGVFGLRASEDARQANSARVTEWLRTHGHPMLGRKHSAETRRKQSESAKRRPPISEATRALFSERSRGRAIPLEAVERSRLARSGKKRTVEQRTSMSAARIGKGLNNQGARVFPEEIIASALFLLRNGCAQVDVAKAYKLSQSYVSRVAAGKRSSSLNRS